MSTERTVQALTAAQLRAKAEDAEAALGWATASLLYDMAADVYPGGVGDLRDKDIAGLRSKARQCRAMVIRP